MIKQEKDNSQEKIDKAIQFYEENKQECVIGILENGKFKIDYYLPAHLSKKLIDILKGID